MSGASDNPPGAVTLFYRDLFLSHFFLMTGSPYSDFSHKSAITKIR